MHNIQRQLREDGICVLTFDRPDSPANIFDAETLAELSAHLNVIADASLGAKGLLLISSKPAIFVAGADLHAMPKFSPEELEKFIALGQETFAKIATLPFPTVAAIHGACVGGGLEVALACDWRIATNDKTTKIGLPETKLGIIPAWGGSMRLPRLIGLAPALQMILAGQTLAAVPAKKRGLIDEIAPKEHLMEAALPLFGRGKRKTPRLGIGDRATMPLIATRAKAETEKKTRGHYPAVMAAIDVVTQAGTASDDQQGLAIERRAVLELARGSASANLIRLFLLSERAKKVGIPGESRPEKVKTAAIIGAGLMGSGIAQWVTARGTRVILRDVDADRVAAGVKNITDLYASGVKRHLLTKNEARDGLDRLSPAPTEVPLQNVDLVIEAAVEKMPIKKTIFARLDEITSQNTVLATNTSALSIGELARATRHPERVVGMHFFNPVHRMQLVEVIVAPETAPSVAARALKFVQGLGKLPVLVKDSPGFVVNRILLPYMVEAAELFRQGAEPKEIDGAMLDFGMPMGPLRLSDEVGTEVAADVAATLSQAFPAWMRMPAILQPMIEAGLLGRKAGRGFYTYEEGRETGADPKAKALRPKAAGAKVPRAELSRRMVLLMINEAARCLEEGIVESAAVIDFAMVMGTGFAPFRGGPLRYADALGIEKVVTDLNELSATAGGHFRPCALLPKMATQHSTFYET